MKLKLILLLTFAAAASSQAAVTFNFDTDLQGFTGSGFNDANTVVSFSTVNGGSMAISNSGTGDRDIAKYFTNSMSTGMFAQVRNELLLAGQNGGTISFDVIFTANSFSGGTLPTSAGVRYFFQRDAFDREATTYGSTQLGASNTRVSFPIPTADVAQANNDGKANFSGTGGSLQLGFGSTYNNATNFTYYIDNITIAAVPEPTSVALLGLSSLLLIRRKR